LGYTPFRLAVLEPPPPEPEVSSRGIALLLEALRSPNARDAWVEFLDTYSPVLYQTARACTSNDDEASDCYLHICERLGRDGFRRLLKFRPEGKASFATWLRVVARNICLDWRRNQFGRNRPFSSLQRLSPLELQIYDQRFVRGATQEETLQQIEPIYPGVTLSDLSTIEERLQSSLTPRQQWILSTRRKPQFSSSIAVAGDEDELLMVNVPDPSPSQESQFVEQEQQSRLERSVARLSTEERLLVQLRFEHDLSLEEIARLCGLQDPYRVHRRLAAILKKLRRAMA
jgi:RNA polymerase sigma factor (sigma-70 family)